ncbi:hypothetical protein SDC9_201339 [bioreactor metagenome]|uniref:Uncharacterized protein n=1 Tax=bioreactor metagenome TaxID=1076179 RepID=A0A645IQM5_9ZZZZ
MIVHGQQAHSNADTCCDAANGGRTNERIGSCVHPGGNQNAAGSDILGTDAGHRFGAVERE